MKVLSIQQHARLHGTGAGLHGQRLGWWLSNCVGLHRGCAGGLHRRLGWWLWLSGCAGAAQEAGLVVVAVWLRRGCTEAAQEAGLVTAGCAGATQEAGGCLVAAQVAVQGCAGG
ncbi:hypothetical protein Acr_10g0006430 [Actinidia rufa]|uniref:Uncharacterized protein n=1 Tax=Actinidia rufa TaxID=165716 RepID=A0A7J0F975_9ERIC|nr:hypothetical protein Acr_10g0006430 [Actinidia rufa]